MMNAAVFKRTSLAMMMALALAACGGGGGGSGGGDNGGGDGDKTAYQPYACSAAVYDKAKELRTMQIMVEAYIDGDSSADYDAGYGTSAHKGDLQGITNNLDYIKGLGINAIWLTPIFESTKKSGQDEWADRLDVTGYFTSNYFKIDLSSVLWSKLELWSTRPTSEACMCSSMESLGTTRTIWLHHPVV